MKNLLKLSYLKHFALGLMLTCVTVSTVWAAMSDKDLNAQQSNQLLPRVCYYFYYEDIDLDPYNYIWDCMGCVKVYNVYPDETTLPQGCNDGV